MSAGKVTIVQTAQIVCPHLTCKKVLAVPPEARGQVVRCSHCQNLLRVPANAPAIRATNAA